MQKVVGKAPADCAFLWNDHDEDEDDAEYADPSELRQGLEENIASGNNNPPEFPCLYSQTPKQCCCKHRCAGLCQEMWQVPCKRDT